MYDISLYYRFILQVYITGLYYRFILQVFAIEFSNFAIEFSNFAIEFVPFAIEFVAFAIECNSLVTRMAAGENTKTWCSSYYKNLFKYNSSKQLSIRQ